jgi:diguanylate cyclase (GGDEF)-like protein/PAS domain S-box-containing protein
VATNQAARAFSAAEAAGLAVDGDAVALVVQTAAGVIEAATPAAEFILGLNRAQLLGRDSADPRWAAIDANGVALRGPDHPSMRAIATGEAVRGAVIGVHRPGQDPAGEHVWLVVDSVPSDFVQGKPASVVSRFAVITDERAFELRLAASERLHRFLVENAPEIIAWQLPDTTFLWVSRSARAILGYEPDQMVGRTAYELMHPHDVATAQDAPYGAREALQAPMPVVVRMRHRDGRYRWMEAAMHVVRDADGNPAQLRTAWRDVSKRVEAERDRDAALRLVESVWENSPIGIAVCDECGVLDRVNRAMCATFKRDPAELVGHSLQEFVHPDDECVDGVAALASGEVTVHESECRYVCGDGTTIWGLRTTVLLRDASENVVAQRYLVHFQDVTERHYAHERLAYAASHDPLTGLANRNALDEHVMQSVSQLRPPACSGMLFIDLDDFKSVNDTYGHQVGDALLKAVAARIVHTIRNGDFAARLGGDEFVVHCPKVQGQAEARAIAQRVAAALSMPYPLEMHTISISASVGVTTAPADDRAQLMKAADRAMYEAKFNGRSLADPRQDG